MFLPEKNEPLEKAKSCALRLLKFRGRSRREIEDRLRQKKFDAQTIDKAVDFLRRLGYIEDLSFARAWARERLRFKPRSRRVIAGELRQKGIDREIIDSVMSDPELESEPALAERIARSKLKAMRKETDVKKKQKMFACLARRGFDAALAQQIIRKIIPGDEE